jgi:Flp pilus assembly protein TadD
VSTLRTTLTLALVVAGCAKTVSPDRAARDRVEIADELPAWRTHGEEVRLAIANDLLESGNTAGALEIVRQMRAEGYDGPELDLVQGRSLRLDGVLSEAQRLLIMAQKRLPQDGRPSADLCLLFADLHETEAAIEACRKATRIDDTDGASWNNLSYLLLSGGDAEAALAAAEQAVEVDGGIDRYRNNLGMAQAALGRVDMAFRTLSSTLDRADAAYMVGLSIERFEGLEAARPWYERALTHNPNHAQARDALAPTPPRDLNPPVEPTSPVAPTPASETTP